MTSLLTARCCSLLRPVMNQIIPQYQRLLNVSAVDLAARKGTREKAKKKKVKVEVKKLTYKEKIKMPRKSHLIKECDKHMNINILKSPPPDQDVFCMRYFRRPPLTFTNAVEGFKQMNHPTMLNSPDAFLNVQIELNMQSDKKTKYRENFSKTALIPHAFLPSLNRTILVFCKDLELKDALYKAGATHVGGDDLIKAIQAGEIKSINYEFVLAQSEIITDILPLRGIMKKKFPNPMTGTTDSDIVGLVSKYVNGIQYKAVKDNYQQNFGLITTTVGKLNMTASQLEENFIALIKDVDSNRPKRAGHFVTRCFLTSPPSKEVFEINPFEYIDPFKKESKFHKTSVEEKVQVEEEEDAEKPEDDKIATTS